jgi:hypothetical protein
VFSGGDTDCVELQRTSERAAECNELLEFVSARVRVRHGEPGLGLALRPRQHGTDETTQRPHVVGRL